MSNVDPDHHDLRPRLGQHSHLDAGVQQACHGGVGGHDGWVNISHSLQDGDN